MRQQIKYPNVIDVNSWHTPATDYPESQIDNFRIHHGRYTRGYYQNWGVKDYILFHVTNPIPVISLQERRNNKWHDWMVDDPPQYWAMQYYAEHAKGKVLTTGLGLGLICHELVKNPNVTDIVVIEKSRKVIELVGSYIPKKISLIHQDFLHFIEQDNTDWDTIIVDLWVCHGKEEKLEALYHGVLPMIPVLKIRYPSASITFHGFQSVSDMKPTSEVMVKKIIKSNE